MTKRHYHASLLCSLLLLPACGGSGGSSALNLQPVLVSAVFIGATSTPAAGDRLQLIMSENVMLTVGPLLDDNDVTLSGGTLGSIAVPPTLVSARVVEVVLGAGVTFTPGTTTIDFNTANDVVRDTTGILVEASSPRVITDGDADDPTVDSLTLNGIVGLLNGSGPAGGTLQVPPNGFTIDLTYSDTSSAVDPAQTLVAVDVQTTAGGAPRAVGENLLADLTVVTASASAASYLVPAALVMPGLTINMTVQVTDTTGRISAPAVFTFKVTFLTNAIRPFETIVNPSQLWYVDLNVLTPVEVNNSANSNPDLLDLIGTIGLQHSSPIPNVIGSKNSNEVVFDQLRAEVLSQLGTLFPGVNITFTDVSPGSFPAPSGFTDYNGAAFSQMCIAGSFDVAGTSGVLGLSLFDPNNSGQENNCLADFQGSRLGVFLHTIVNSGFLQSPVSLFRQTYDPFTPSRSGTPIGADAADDQRLTNVLNDARATQIDLAIQSMARFAAVVAGHEMGHSMGLVKNGPMPAGLYANDPTNFPGSSDSHIMMPASIFTGGAINLMTPALSFEGTLVPTTRLNTLNLAYLREQALYNLP
ncbi:MAG: hypothetical protein ACYST0_03255 [Planctomycetota bacterium]|jgi:hypothetical protein